MIWVKQAFTRLEAQLPPLTSGTTSVEALVSAHPQEAKKVSVTGAGRLREALSYGATRGVRDGSLKTKEKFKS